MINHSYRTRVAWEEILWHYGENFHSPLIGTCEIKFTLPENIWEKVTLTLGFLPSGELFVGPMYITKFQETPTQNTPIILG
jgi:hypothetical protein